jgi:medium-chain acyl-[acyl-carrier-protein] hydrolase
MKNLFDHPFFFPLRPSGVDSSLNLFIFHYSGGTASQFRPWSNWLDSLIDPIGIQLPGRENRFGEPLFFEAKDAIESLIEVFPKNMNTPFIVFGHSMGATLAFEFVRALREKNFNLPEHLIISGRAAPHIPSCHKPIYHLNKEEFLEELIKYNGMPKEVLNSPELLDLFIPIVQADFSISDTYQYSPESLLSFPITAFGGINDSYVLEEDLRVWGLHTESIFKHYMFEGDHFFLIKDSCLRVVDKINTIASEIV